MVNFYVHISPVFSCLVIYVSLLYNDVAIYCNWLRAEVIMLKILWIVLFRISLNLSALYYAPKFMQICLFHMVYSNHLTALIECSIRVYRPDSTKALNIYLQNARITILCIMLIIIPA